MSFNLHQRKPTRQPGIDYTRPGFYFVTVCTQEKEEILGKIIGENMEPNDYGNIVRECWLDLPNHYRCCRLHEFVIMPNHVHGIIEIVGGKCVGADSYVGEGFKPSRSYSLPEILRAFKTFSSRTINQKYPDGLFQWQRSFHDRVIRDKGELTAIARYIVENPRHWSEDEEIFCVGAGLKPARTLKPKELKPARVLCSYYIVCNVNAGRFETDPYMKINERRGGFKTRPYIKTERIKTRPLLETTKIF